MFTKSRKTTLISLVILVILVMSMSACDYVKDEQKEVSSDTSVKTGSSVEYTLSIADSEQKITGAHIEFFFDPQVLQLKSVNTDNIPGSSLNENSNDNGRVTVVNGFINGGSGVECREKTDLVTLTFDVIKDGDAQIEYYIPYIYDYDMVNISNYTFTQKLSIDGEVVKDNVAPVLAGDETLGKYKDFDKGDFDNNSDGKARDN